MKTLIYMLISFLAFWVLLRTMFMMAEGYPSQGYNYGQNLDVGSNMPTQCYIVGSPHYVEQMLDSENPCNN